jgi:hypothetical protein
VKTSTQANIEKISISSTNENIKLIDELWALEAESRLTAYQKGEIPAIDLTSIG